MFRTLRDHDGTPLVALDADELASDGVITKNGQIPEKKQVHVQRVSEGAYLIRDVDEENGIVDLDLPELLSA
jgi:hypothetical protein